MHLMLPSIKEMVTMLPCQSDNLAVFHALTITCQRDKKEFGHQKVRILDEVVRITCNKLAWTFSEFTSFLRRALI